MNTKDKEIYEGWTAQDFVDDLAPLVGLIMSDRASTRPFETKQDLKEWLANNQPYYKKPIAKVTNYFAKKYDLK